MFVTEGVRRNRPLTVFLRATKPKGERCGRVERGPLAQVPLASRRLEAPDASLLLPPRTAIARRLVEEWLERT